MISIAANELKKKGISVLSGQSEALITVRGTARYVLLDIEVYEKLRESELEAALAQAQLEVKSGNFVVESVVDHIKRITE